MYMGVDFYIGEGYVLLRVFFYVEVRFFFLFFVYFMSFERLWFFGYYFYVGCFEGLLLFFFGKEYNFLIWLFF